MKNILFIEFIYDNNNYNACIIEGAEKIKIAQKNKFIFVDASKCKITSSKIIGKTNH